MNDPVLDDSIDLGPAPLPRPAGEILDRAFVLGAGVGGLTAEAFGAAMRAHEHRAALDSLIATMGPAYRLGNGLYPGLGRYRRCAPSRRVVLVDEGTIYAREVEVEDPGCWEPAADRQDGALCITIPLLAWRGRCGRPESLLALDMLLIDLAEPSEWALRRGHAWALGIERVAALRDGALIIGAAPRVLLCPTPLAWLEAGGNPTEWRLLPGVVLREMARPDLPPVCVLDWNDPEADALLLELSPVCAHAAQAAEISARRKAAKKRRQAWADPPSPPIAVMQREAA
jgi:hypothetical protein